MEGRYRMDDNLTAANCRRVYNEAKPVLIPASTRPCLLESAPKEEPTLTRGDFFRSDFSLNVVAMAFMRETRGFSSLCDTSVKFPPMHAGIQSQLILCRHFRRVYGLRKVPRAKTRFWT
jgi:hypothetical protein